MKGVQYAGTNNSITKHVVKTEHEINRINSECLVKETRTLTKKENKKLVEVLYDKIM